MGVGWGTGIAGTANVKLNFMLRRRLAAMPASVSRLHAARVRNAARNRSEVRHSKAAGNEGSRNRRKAVLLTYSILPSAIVRRRARLHRPPEAQSSPRFPLTDHRSILDVEIGPTGRPILRAKETTWLFGTAAKS